MKPSTLSFHFKNTFRIGCSFLIIFCLLQCIPHLTFANTSEIDTCSEPTSNLALEIQEVTPVFSNWMLYLNDIIYENGQPIQARLYLDDGASKIPNPVLLLVSPQTKDMEYLELQAVSQGLYQTTGQVTAATNFSSNAPTSNDGVLEMRPNEQFFAMYYPKTESQIGRNELPDVIYDFGVMAQDGFSDMPVEVLPALAQAFDETPIEGKRVGTLLIEGEFPIQMAMDELIFRPLNQRQFNRFIESQKAEIIDRDIPEGANPYSTDAAYLLRIENSRGDARHLSQLRSAWGLEGKLYGSSEMALSFAALNIQYLMDGYLVTPNIRMYQHGNAATAWSPTPSPKPTFSDQISDAKSGSDFDVPKIWAYMALWDKDEKNIPVAFLDMGFAPNDDFKSGGKQCDMEGNVRCGNGTAVSPPTIGASGVGSKVWHGNGVVATAGAKINNDYGTGGTGGQVVQPYLYRYGLGSYIFSIGKGIKKAADDGASVINVSAGYPCRYLTNIFGWTPSLCGVGDRAAFCGAVTATLIAAAAATCAIAAATSWIPVVNIATGAACVVATTAVAVGTTACIASLFAGDLKGIMQRGVNHALQKGVPITASAGNILSASAFPEIIQKIVNLDRRRQTTEEWQIIPAVLPGVLCIGAANPNKSTNYENLHFHGKRIDIWAPIKTNYWAPKGTDRVLPSDRQHGLIGRFGGTSAAAPYIAGLIANVQAINPQLDPRNPRLSVQQRRSIPANIRSLLVNTAYTLRERPAGSRKERRNLVNPMRFTQAAAKNSIPNVASKGYDTSLNYGGGEAKGDDIAGKGTYVDALKDVEFTGTILNIPAGNSRAKALIDVDYYDWWTSTQEGNYSGGFVELIYPDGWGELLLNNDQVAPIQTRVQQGEKIKRYELPSMGKNALRSFKVSGNTQNSDNVYKIRFYKSTFTRPMRTDRFDSPGGNNNPNSPGHNNSLQAATILGNHGINWYVNNTSGGLNNVNGNTYEITLNDLNIHNATDEDWFKLDGLAELTELQFAACDQSRLTISFSDFVNVDVYNTQNQKMQSLKRVRSATIYGRDTYGSFRVTPAVKGKPTNYHMKLSYKAMKERGCYLYGVLIAYPMKGYGTETECVSCKAMLSSRNILLGRIMEELENGHNPLKDKEYGISWSGEGRFKLLAKMVEGEALGILLKDAEGNVIRRTATPAMRNELEMNGEEIEMSRTGVKGLIQLQMEHLPQGVYFLEFTTATPEETIEAEVYLPQQAIGEPSISSEEYGHGQD